MSLRVVFAVVAALAVAASLSHAYTLAYAADGLPTWDPAGYLLEAVKLQQSFSSFDLWGIVKGLTKPDLHPPLHSGLLGLWLTVFGNTMDAARAYPIACFVVSLGLLGWIGHRAIPGRGLEVGLGAAVLTALGSGNLELLTSPMTESTGLLTQLLALGLAVTWADRRDARAQLYIGIAIFAASLVRFNMAPMLLVPLYVHHAWRNFRDKDALLDPRVLLWAAPTLVGFAVWQLARPDLFGFVQKFFENRSSGLEFWSVENLLFVPLATHRAYLPWLGALLYVPFLIGLVPWKRAPGAVDTPSGAGLGRLQAYVIVGFAALTWHDFKISRNLATALPVFYLCALAPLATIRLSAGPVVALGGLLGLCGYGAWQHTTTLADLAKRTDFQPDPVAHEALHFIERHAREREQVWVTGWVFRLSPNLIDYWLRVNGVSAKVRLDQQLFGTQTRTGVEASWTEEYAKWAEEFAMAPEHRDRTTYITIETAPGTRYYDQWKAFGNFYARAFAEQKLLPEVDRLEMVDEGMTLRVYRAGGTPSEATLAGQDSAPTPADDAGVILPEGLTPIARETFHARARKWTAFPPVGKDKVELVREGSALEVRVKEAQASLQICNAVDAAPAQRFTAVLNASTAGVDGKVFVHFRGMGADAALQKLPDGAFDITHAGPLGPGSNAIVKEVSLGPTSPQLRVCVMLDGTTGTIRLEDLAFYAVDTPVKLPVGAAGVTGAGAPAPAATGWKLFPANAAGATLTMNGARVTASATMAHPQLQACGPTIAWKPPMTGAVRASGNLSEGKAFVHLRALDAEAVLLKKDDGTGHIEHIGPLAGAGAQVDASRSLPFPADTALVRPCIVMDGVVGSVSLDALTVVSDAP
jgi:hypothetical protein